MSKLKTTSCRNPQILSDHLKKKKKIPTMGDEKENESSQLGTREKKINTRGSSEVQSKEKKLKECGNLFSSALKPEMKSSHLGFWSKKVQDLEKSTKKNKKSELYEFSCTDESETSYKTKKKAKQKRTQKERQPIETKHKEPKKKTNKTLEPEENIHKRLLFRKQTTTKRGRKNFTLSTGLPFTAALTSTPTVNKDNLVDPSSTLFLSPIIKEDHKYFSVNEYPTVKLNCNDCSPVTHFDQKIPKVETRLRRLSCRRVLRNGKMLVSSTFLLS